MHGAGNEDTVPHSTCKVELGRSDLARPEPATRKAWRTRCGNARAATVRTEDQARPGLTPEPRHSQRIRHQAGLHVRLHAPAHHQAAEQVDHHGQVQPALVGGDVGDVAAPDPVRSLGREVPGQQVFGHRQAVFAVGGDDELPLAARLDAVRLHEALHAVLAHTNAAREQRSLGEVTDPLIEGTPSSTNCLAG
jgi:hypothetical protein